MDPTSVRTHYSNIWKILNCFQVVFGYWLFKKVYASNWVETNCDELSISGQIRTCEYVKPT